jgi:hypothetical protein
LGRLPRTFAHMHFLATGQGNARAAAVATARKLAVLIWHFSAKNDAIQRAGNVGTPVASAGHMAPNCRSIRTGPMSQNRKSL